MDIDINTLFLSFSLFKVLIILGVIIGAVIVLKNK
ncbi:Uncharacterised protein [Clostridium carnis]|nr:hypothetical protein CNEO4_990124 [Clostridium neonatale]VDG74179.1 Uncharacterised protein [Clostridium carnis]